MEDKLAHSRKQARKERETLARTELDPNEREKRQRWLVYHLRVIEVCEKAQLASATLDQVKELLGSEYFTLLNIAPDASIPPTNDPPKQAMPSGKTQVWVPLPSFSNFSVRNEIMDSEDDLRNEKILGEFETQSDRGTVILGAAYLEYKIKKALMVRLLETSNKKSSEFYDKIFNEEAGAVCTFSRKIDMAYALDIIGPHTYHDLGIIRKLRNKFAHWLEEDGNAGSPERPLTFASPKIAELCELLRFPKNYYAGTWALLNPQLNTCELNTRDMFIRAILTIAITITVYYNYWPKHKHEAEKHGWL